MSAILSADDLNDFISPGVACIKPIETLPNQQPPEETTNAYEVTTEDKVDAGKAPPAQISLTDCLACSGCVTSAEAVLVSLQSHGEVLDTLDRYGELGLAITNDQSEEQGAGRKVFVASVSPQVRASLAATYNVSEQEAGHMIGQLLSGPYGLRSGGKNKSGFTWVLDTNAMRDACLVAAAEEVQQSLAAQPEGQKKPILTSACPGWICYAEKTHPHILPHLSKLKSPQALTGTLVKSVLAKRFGIAPANVWHLAVMPCFDKKLEASRAELTSYAWQDQAQAQEEGEAVRDVDCVITARELLMLAESRNVSFPCLPRTPLAKAFAPSFPDHAIDRYLLSRSRGQKRKRIAAAEPQDIENSALGTSGGYLQHILRTQQAAHPGSRIQVQRGRNADVSDYFVLDGEGRELFRAARYYGFRNIQNLVRRLKPAKASRMPGASRRPAGGARRTGGAAAASGTDGEYAYVEVMACPGGCTNGGGQIKVGDVLTLRQVGGTGIENGSHDQEVLPAQKEWLAKVDEAYWSADLDDLASDDEVPSREDEMTSELGHATNGTTNGMNYENENVSDVIDGIDHRETKAFLDHWAHVTGVELSKLMCTSYRVVESDVGKKQSGPGGEMERVAGLAVQVGGGW